MRKLGITQVKYPETQSTQKKDLVSFFHAPDSAEKSKRIPTESASRTSKASNRYASISQPRALSPMTASVAQPSIYPISHIVKEPDFRRIRPISAPYRNATVFASNRSNHVAKQEESVKRLYRGSRGAFTSFGDVSENPLFRLSDVEAVTKAKEVENLQMKKDVIEHKALMSSFRTFRNLVFDLDFNFDLSRDAVTTDDPNDTEIQQGTIFALQESAQRIALERPEELLELYSREGIGALLKGYTQHIRGLLRVLKAKGLSSECELLELLWKLATKLFDTAALAHDRLINDTVEMAKYKVREEVERRRKLQADMNSRLEKEDQKCREQAEKQAEQIRSLLVLKQSLENHLEERQITISKLQSVTTRDESVKEMTSFYTKMDRYLTEAESEQVKQLATLENISVIMELANKFEEKQPNDTHEVQTDWTVCDPKVSLPLLSRPVFSLHPYYSLLLTADEVSHVSRDTVLADMETILDQEQDFDKPRPVYVRLVQKLGKESQQIETLASKLAGYCHLLQALEVSGDPRASVYVHLLGLTTPLPSQPELRFFYQLRNAMKTLEATDGASLGSVLEAVQQGFVDAKDEGCRLLEKLRVTVARPQPASGEGSLTNYVQNEIIIQASDELIILLCRLALAQEKQKKSWKAQIETMDPHKTGIVQVGQIVEHIAGMIWVSDKEMQVLARHFDKKGSGQVRVGDAIQSFDFGMFLETAHRAYVSKDLFLLSALTLWREHALNGMPGDLPLNDFRLFTLALKDAVTDIDDFDVAKCYLDVFLGNWRDVLVTQGMFNKLEVKEIKKSDKKAKSKKKR